MDALNQVTTRWTLIDVIRQVSQAQSKGITFINGETDEKFVSYQNLYHKSLEILSTLQRKGMNPPRN